MKRFDEKREVWSDGTAGLEMAILIVILLLFAVIYFVAAPAREVLLWTEDLLK